MNDLRRGMVTAALIVTLAVVVLVSLACCGTREVFDYIDGFTPTPTVTATSDTCIPECVDLCTQIQEKHGGQPDLCAADCAAVCAEAEAGE
jgi:hypothetical protein